MKKQVFNKKPIAYLILFLVSLSYFIGQSFVKEISSDFFNENNYLNDEVVNLVIKDIRKGVFPEYLKLSPDLFEYLVDELVNADLELVSNEDQSEHLILTSELLLELTIASNRFKNLTAVRSNTGQNIHLYELNEYLLKISNEAAGLSEVDDQIAANLLMFSAIDSPQHPSFTDSKLQEIYSASLKRQVRFNQLPAAIIIVMWLDRDSVTFNENIDYMIELKQSVTSAGDLIRLMNHSEDQVVLKTTQLIKNIVPDNAIHALRYHLIHSNNVDIQLAVLDAIAEYGIEARSYVNQLKAFLRVSKSDQVKQKIQIVLKQVNGL